MYSIIESDIISVWGDIIGNRIATNEDSKRDDALVFEQKKIDAVIDSVKAVFKKQCDRFFEGIKWDKTMYAQQPKKMLVMNIPDILRKYTDEDHRLSQKDIIEILKTE